MKEIMNEIIEYKNWCERNGLKANRAESLDLYMEVING